MKEAMKQALEALEFFSDTSNSAMDKAMSEDAITSLRQAIAEAEAYNCKNCITNSPCVCKGKDFKPCGAFVTVKQQQALDRKADNARELGLDYEPPQRQPLTDKQRIKIVKDNTVQGYHGDYFDAWGIIDDVERGYNEQDTTPPQRTWVGLTDEEINKVLGGDIHDEPNGLLEFVRAIEAKLKEKNT